MRGAFSHQRRTMALIAAAGVLALSAGGVWLATRPTGAQAPEPADARVMRQIRVQAGHGAELRYSEPGQRRAVCGHFDENDAGAAPSHRHFERRTAEE